MTSTAIGIATTIHAPRAAVWKYYNEPEHIVGWNFASDDWICPSASVDLRPGGALKSRMESKDGKMGFDFEAVYSEVSAPDHLAYTIADGRKVTTHFADTPKGVLVTTVFEPDSVYDPEFQRGGWQAILDNFKKYAELQTGH